MIIIEIINDGTGDERIGNYDFKVRIGGLLAGHVIAKGRVENHRRRLGWRSLVKKVVRQAGRQKDKKKGR